MPDPKMEIDVLLAEYQASYMNRDHYDSLRWTIGALFIGASLATFGISFLVQGFVEVFLTILFSELLFVAFIGYDQLVQPYVEISIKRCLDLEETIRTRTGCDAPILHSAIRERTGGFEKKTEEKKSKRWPRGINLTDFLIGTTTVLWILRLSIFWLPTPFLPGIPKKLIAVALVTGIGILLFIYRRRYPHGLDLDRPVELKKP